jgi:hypothetical protein
LLPNTATASAVSNTDLSDKTNGLPALKPGRGVAQRNRETRGRETVPIMLLPGQQIAPEELLLGAIWPGRHPQSGAEQKMKTKDYATSFTVDQSPEEVAACFAIRRS